MVDDIRAVNLKKKKFCFEMQTPDRNYHLAAENEEQMKQWVEVLAKARDAAKGQAGPPPATSVPSTSSTATAVSNNLSRNLIGNDDTPFFPCRINLGEHQQKERNSR